MCDRADQNKKDKRDRHKEGSYGSEAFYPSFPNKLWWHQPNHWDNRVVGEGRIQKSSLHGSENLKDST